MLIIRYMVIITAIIIIRKMVTCLRPLCVSAEHSRYFTARILFASF